MASGDEVLNGEFTDCMGPFLFGSDHADFAIRLTQCVNHAGPGSTKDGATTFLQRTSSELAVLALMISLVSVMINVLLCAFLCARREYQELGTAEPDCMSEEEEEEPHTPVKRYTNTKTSVWDQPDFANFDEVK
mmetsp:Transcript_31341/g.57482  ORF Transcript_31341/g.57482 Transcript_31341/m.57482 type:complete len:134 (-) Transcript_31341:91-492(-)